MKIDLAAGFNLRELFPAAPAEMAMAEGSTALTLESVQTNTSADFNLPRNMLENNFINSSQESSKYTLGLLTSLQVQNSFSNKLNGIIESYKLDADSADSYAEKTLDGKKAARAVGEAIEAEVSTTEAERMNRERKEAEEEEEKRIEAEAAGDNENTASPETIADEVRNETSIDQDARNEDAKTASAGSESVNSELVAQQAETTASSQSSTNSHINIIV